MSKKYGRRPAHDFDGRTWRARRFRELIDAYAAGFGTQPPGPREMALIRQAAAVTLEAEQLQMAIVRGDAIDSDMLVRVSNVLARSLQAVGLKPANPKAVAPAMSLRDQLMAGREQ